MNAATGDRWSSGQRGLGQTQDVVRFRGGCRETIILRPEPGDLELQGLHPGTQSSDLVEQAPVGRRTYVAVEGLRHFVSYLFALPVWPANARPAVSHIYTHGHA